MTVAVDEIEVADPASSWTQAGFTVGSDAICRIGTVGIRLAGRGRGDGIVGWSLRGIPSSSVLEDLDGIPTTRSGAGPSASSEHPNGVTAIDHVVLLSPNVDRTIASLASVGENPRGTRDAELGGQSIRQVFFRFDDVIIEVVGSPNTASHGPSTLWGITYIVTDIDATASFFGDHTSRVKDAVQPGRRITTLRHRDLGISVRSAMISTRAD